MSQNIFDRSGKARLSDLTTPEHADLLALLKNYQDFFTECGHNFMSKRYLLKWPQDSLRWWSRIWEYPFVYHHLKSQTTNSVIMDFGSGVTFFPFSVAELGQKVICIDNDIDCVQDMQKAIKHVPLKKGQVEIEQFADGKIPLANESFDAAYSVSVIEHIPKFEGIIREIARTLKKGGLFLLTIDCDLIGNYSITEENRKKLGSVIEEYFEYVHPPTSVSEKDLLRSDRGPYPYTPPSKFWQLAGNVKRRIQGLSPICQPTKLLLTVEGFVLKKKE